MIAKEYLQQLQKINLLINQRLQEKEDLNMMSKSIRGFDYARTRVQTSRSEGASFTRTIEKILALEEEISGLIQDYAELKHKIIGEIQGLQNSKSIEILHKKYVEGKGLETVADEMGYTFQYVVLLHGNALKEFSSKYSIYFQC